MTAAPDRFAVLIFRVSGDTDDDTVDGVVSMMVPPTDWTYEAGSVVNGPGELRLVTSGIWS